MAREIKLQRIFSDNETTIGYMVDLTDMSLQGYTCEDQRQVQKIMKETRIWAGRYKLVLNKVVTDKTKEYQKKFPWFKYHIMVENVKDFAGIYIHIGNNEKNTDGCILLGDTLHNLSIPAIAKGNPLTESTDAFERFYKKYFPILESGKEVYITIIDEPK